MIGRSIPDRRFSWLSRLDDAERAVAGGLDHGALATVPAMGETAEHVVRSGLKHNYGDASDVPDLLAACASPDADTACDALADLSNKLYHQGRLGLLRRTGRAAAAGRPRLQPRRALSGGSGRADRPAGPRTVVEDEQIRTSASALPR
jgi:hypothetical protein